MPEQPPPFGEKATGKAAVATTEHATAAPPPPTVPPPPPVTPPPPVPAGGMPSAPSGAISFGSITPPVVSAATVKVDEQKHKREEAAAADQKLEQGMSIYEAVLENIDKTKQAMQERIEDLQKNSGYPRASIIQNDNKYKQLANELTKLKHQESSERARTAKLAKDEATAEEEAANAGGNDESEVASAQKAQSNETPKDSTKQQAKESKIAEGGIGQLKKDTEAKNKASVTSSDKQGKADKPKAPEHKAAAKDNQSGGSEHKVSDEKINTQEEASFQKHIKEVEDQLKSKVELEDKALKKVEEQRNELNTEMKAFETQSEARLQEEIKALGDQMTGEFIKGIHSSVQAVQTMASDMENNMKKQKATEMQLTADSNQLASNQAQVIHALHKEQIARKNDQNKLKAELQKPEILEEAQLKGEEAQLMGTKAELKDVENSLQTEQDGFKKGLKRVKVLDAEQIKKAFKRVSKIADQAKKASKIASEKVHKEELARLRNEKMADVLAAREQATADADVLDATEGSGVLT
eukprot:gnl/TRDRNA2_/TRDRNA2_74253_c0_seq1.p1 gnl/TRDRNA2_/TRDRNA2_74253_c0~~gnl/TRDRNA2_/TRDRNA2_74253_c0_seq1.p1  ORF type:complete len:592 (-),score=172.27 gnl/TRDRNA2_/TRDRNA2_74253_c0_seq1:135-1709(-)